MRQTIIITYVTFYGANVAKFDWLVTLKIICMIFSFPIVNKLLFYFMFCFEIFLIQATKLLKKSKIDYVS